MFQVQLDIANKLQADEVEVVLRTQPKTFKEHQHESI